MNEENINNSENTVSLANGAYDSLKNLAESLRLCANYDDLLYIREYYQKLGYYPTENELYMLDAILKKRKSFSCGYAFSKAKITDAAIANSYVNIIADINRQNPKRRPIPPSADELMHVRTGNEQSFSAEVITDRSVFQNEEALSVKAPNGTLLFSVKSKSTTAPASPYPTGSAFIMLEPTDNVQEDTYLFAAEKLCRDKELQNIILGVEQIGRFGILTTLASLCDGVYVDPTRLSDLSLPFAPADFAVAYEGRILIVTNKENVDDINKISSKYGLCAVYFAKATSTGNLTVNRDIVGGFSLSCQFIKAIAYTPEYAEAVINCENASLGYEPSPITFENTDPEVACSDTQNVRRYNGKIISCSLAMGSDRPYTKAMCVVNDAINSLISCGVNKKDITVSLRYGYAPDQISNEARGVTFAMFLGAYEARKKECVNECASLLIPTEDLPFVACMAYADINDEIDSEKSL
jgi:hypothetical protein